VVRVRDALPRSRHLTRGRFWHVFRTLALTWMILLLLMIAVGLGLGFLQRFANISDDMIGFLSNWVFVVLMPLLGAASSVLYFDLRVRSEAYDIQHLAKNLGGT
ncbi:MAG: hypothetical protein ACREPM_10245, partial [Gemmatimonadaceae bacterium]